MRNYLNHTLKLYSTEEQIERLKIDYTLTDDKQEKQALKVAILYLKEKN